MRPEPEAFDLRAARLNRGLSIRSAARAAGVKENVVARLEDGRGVHPSSAKKVADFFDVRVTDFPGMREKAGAR